VSDPTETKRGAYAGVALAIRGEETVGLETGLFYAGKGVAGGEQGSSVAVDLDYLEVPVLLRVALPEAAGIVPRFLLGPAVAWRARCRVAIASDGSDALSVPCDDGGIRTRAVDFGLVGSIGVSIPVSGIVSLTFDCLYNRGLRSISAVGTPTKNSVISVLGGVSVLVR
jgi:hypothetical protein